MGHSKYLFPKREKLTGKKNIEKLFSTGSCFHLSAFRVRYLSTTEEKCHRILVSVPKKNFKRAVDRNLLKRRIREAYRLNKQRLYRNDQKEFCYIAFVYLSQNISTFHEIQDQLIKCLKRLNTCRYK